MQSTVSNALPKNAKTVMRCIVQPHSALKHTTHKHELISERPVLSSVLPPSVHSTPALQHSHGRQTVL